MKSPFAIIGAFLIGLVAARFLTVYVRRGATVDLLPLVSFQTYVVVKVGNTINFNQKYSPSEEKQHDDTP
jgi:hypothetical protein